MMFKYLIFDLDGTLLNTKKQINKTSLSAINELHKSGVCIIICSGRHIKEIIPYANTLSLSMNDIIISCDGLYIYRAIEYEQLWHGKFLNHSDILNIIKHITKKRCLIYTNEHDFLYTKSMFSFLKYTLLRYLGMTRMMALLNIEYISGDIEKVRILETGFTDFKRAYTVYEYDTMTEILASGVSKYNALIQLEQMGLLDLASSIFWGDDINDTECFEHIQHSVAMGNAIDSIKQKASYVTKSNDDDGILEALKHYFPKIFNKTP